MKTEIIVVRHGETKWNNMHRYQGIMDIELNEKGYEQARKAGEFLRNREINYLYASDLKRARNTAEIITEHHNIKLNALEGLREMNFGEWEGMNFKEIGRDYHDLFEKWKEDPTSVSPPGGEMLAEVQERIIDSLEKIISTQKEDNTILVVSHGGAIRIMLAYYLKIPLQYFWRIDIDNASISKMIFFDGAPIIKSVNCTAHLKN